MASFFNNDRGMLASQGRRPQGLLTSYPTQMPLVQTRSLPRNTGQFDYEILDDQNLNFSSPDFNFSSPDFTQGGGYTPSNFEYDVQDFPASSTSGGGTGGGGGGGGMSGTVGNIATGLGLVGTAADLAGVDLASQAGNALGISDVGSSISNALGLGGGASGTGLGAVAGKTALGGANTAAAGTLGAGGGISGASVTGGAAGAGLGGSGAGGAAGAGGISGASVTGGAQGAGLGGGSGGTAAGGASAGIGAGTAALGASGAALGAGVLYGLYSGITDPEAARATLDYDDGTWSRKTLSGGDVGDPFKTATDAYINMLNQQGVKPPTGYGPGVLTMEPTGGGLQLSREGGRVGRGDNAFTQRAKTQASIEAAGQTPDEMQGIAEQVKKARSNRVKSQPVDTSQAVSDVRRVAAQNPNRGVRVVSGKGGQKRAVRVGGK